MTRFCIGDKVRVAGLPSSQWRDFRGTVIETVDHGPYKDFGLIQECAVDVAGQKRWFMAKHLARIAPPDRTRLFQAELLARWQLEPGDVAALNEDRHQLVDLLRRRFDFAASRAEAEANEFFTMFDARIARAVEGGREDEAPPGETSKQTSKNAA